MNHRCCVRPSSSPLTWICSNPDTSEVPPTIKMQTPSLYLKANHHNLIAISVRPTSTAPRLSDPSEAQFLSTSTMSFAGYHGQEISFAVITKSPQFWSHSFPCQPPGWWMLWSLSWAQGCPFLSGRCDRKSICMLDFIQAWEGAVAI